MEFTYVLPILGTVLLGLGIVMPIRDGRRGRKATIGGTGPVKAEFRFEEAPSKQSVVPSEPLEADAERRSLLVDPASPAAGSTADPVVDRTANESAFGTSLNASASSTTPHLGSRPSLERTIAELPTVDETRPLFRRFDLPDASMGQPPSAVPVRSLRKDWETAATSMSSDAVGESRSREDPAAESNPGGGAAGGSTGVTHAGEPSPTAIDPVAAEERPPWHDAASAALTPLKRIFGRRQSSASPPTPPSSPSSDPCQSFEQILESLPSPIAAPSSDDANEALPSVVGEETGPPRDASQLVSISPCSTGGDAKPEHSESFVSGVVSVGGSSRSGDVVEPSPQIASGAVDVRRTGEPEIRTRAVPLTRLPLRPVVATVTWTEQLEPPLSDLTAEHRLRVLREFADSDSQAAPEAALRGAWYEERGEARTVALRLLARRPSLASVDVFRDSLRSGTEQERSLAVDACASIRAFRELEAALNDRVDAIVARASLAISPSRCLADHKILLSGRLGAERCEAVLGLLAGILQ